MKLTILLLTFSLTSHAQRDSTRIKDSITTVQVLRSFQSALNKSPVFDHSGNIPADRVLELLCGWLIENKFYIKAGEAVNNHSK